MPKKRVLSESESEHSESSNSSDEKVKNVKKGPESKKKKVSKSKADENEWSLSDKRKIKVTEFKGKHYVMIRDFYEDSEGKVKPTKQGVNLSIDQWKQLKSFIPEIDEVVDKL